MATRSELAIKREKYIREQEAILLKKVSGVEKQLYKSIFDKIIKGLDESNGKIVSNGKNIDLVTAIDKIFKDLQGDELLKIIKGFSTGLTGVQQLNEAYFKAIEEDKKKLAKITQQSNEATKKRLGITDKGGIVKKGFLDKLVKDKTVIQKIKKETYKAITSGRSLEDYKSKIKTMIQGTDKVNGELVRHFDTFARDAFNQVDRTTQKFYADKLDLDAFIYAGGTINASRCFCINHNGKVYTREESQEWGDDLMGTCQPIWDESVDGKYQPLVMLGGYNCRHSLNWISSVEAKRRRKDL